MAHDSGWGTVIAIVLVVAAVKGCSSPSSSDVEEASAADVAVDASADYAADTATYGLTSSTDYSSAGDEGEAEREPFDEDAAKQSAEDDLASETYTVNGSPYGCTIDCSGHEAGWQWRAQHGYSTQGNSQSFAEGGQAFDDAVDERVEEMKSDYDNGEEPDY